MDTQEILLISAVGTVIAAVGTVGALFASLGALKAGSTERRRAEVQGVRGWIEWEETENSKLRRVQISALGYLGLLMFEEWITPTFHIENESSEFIYDIRFSLSPASLMEVVDESCPQLKPGGEYLRAIDENVKRYDVENVPISEGPGLEIVFTDSRGDRWNRSTAGRLKRLPPLRWYAPWRVPHDLDLGRLHWWFMHAHWKLRWHYLLLSDPPPFWAVDIRWKRWRYTRKTDPIEIRWWNIFEKYRQRHLIFERRVWEGLSKPWWALDDHFRYWGGFEYDKDGDIITLIERAKSWRSQT